MTENTEKELRHISQIENPQLTEETIAVEAIVSGTSLSYLVPHRFTVKWFTDDDEKEETDWMTLTDPDLLKCVCVSDSSVRNLLARKVGAPAKKTSIEVLEYFTVYKLRVRPVIFGALEFKDDKVVDEKGYEYKAYEVYLVSEKQLTFQPSSRIILKGQILPDPKTQKSTLHATEVEFPDAFGDYDKEKLRILYNKFDSMTLKDRINWILENFEIYSDITGRRNLAYTSFLSYFSPIWIRFNRNRQRGWVLVLLIGDSTTGKSETLRKMKQLLRAGTLITAETATSVGLTGAAIQVDGGEWITDWGFLVLNDGGLLAIDGAQKLSHHDWATLAEVERNGLMVQAKAAKGSAPARTRQIKSANAVHLDLGRYSTREMHSFLHLIQAVPTVMDKTSIARLDLVAVSDARTVKIEEVNTLKTDTPDEDLPLLSEALRWSWSQSAAIEFTEKATDLILEKATMLYNKFSSTSIPLVGINIKWKLARLSAAIATLTLSTTPEFNKITVTEEHVNEIVSLIDTEYTQAGLHSLAKAQKTDLIGYEDVVETLQKLSMAAEVSIEEAAEILAWIPIQGVATRNQIKERFNLSDNKQLRPLVAVLQNLKLVKSGGKGFSPLSNLIQVCQLLQGPLAEEILQAAKVEEDAGGVLHSRGVRPVRLDGLDRFNGHTITPNNSNNPKTEDPPSNSGEDLPETLGRTSLTADPEEARKDDGSFGSNLGARREGKDHERK